MDTRAQGSISIARFGLALGTGAVMIWMIGLVADQVLPKAEGDLSPARQQGTTWLEQGIDLIPLAILLIALFSVIILAVYQRELI
jgi:hypothetical protein